MSLLSHFAAVLVATGTVAPEPKEPPPRLTFNRAVCEMYTDGTSYVLCRASKPNVAERTCAAEWERESDAWWSCVVGLESWRCEVQGWCDGGRVVETMPTPDPAFAGRIDWDTL